MILLTKRSRRVGDPGVLQEVGSGGTELVVELERELEEVDSLGRDIGRDGGFRLGGADLEDGLHLGELWPRVFASQHLDDQAANTPDIRFERVCLLLYDLWRHPEDGALEGWAVCAVAREQVCGDGIVSYQIACSRVGGLLTVFDLLGNTEVRDLDTTLVVDKHVSAFDVPVDDVALVEVV